MQIRTTLRPQPATIAKRRRRETADPSRYRDQVTLSSSKPANPLLSKAKALGVGTLVGLAAGALALTGPLGFAAGVGLSAVTSAVLKVDPADTVRDSATTGATFGLISAGMSAALGVPGVLTGGLISGIRAAICR